MVGGNKDFIGKTLLERFDLLVIMFLFYLGGILFYENIPVVIPLKYPILKEKLLAIVSTAFLSYLLGKAIGKNVRHNYINFRTEYLKKHLQKIKLIIFFFSLICLAFYLLRGIPILARGEEAAALKLQLTSQRSFGATRILYVLLPYITIVLYSMVKNHKNNVNTNVKYISYMLICFLLLSFGLFKGALITYILTIVFVYDKYCKRINISMKSIIIGICTIAIIILPIFLTEINDFGKALLYLLNRLIIYSWEGFNYIVLYDLPPDINLHFQGFIGLKQVESADVILGAEFTRINPPPIAIVPTLFGFCYRNGGIPLVVITFIILGFIVERIIKKFARTQDEVKSTTYIFLYIVFFKMMLVGNVFNDIRGPILSLVVIHYVSRIILNKRKIYA